MRLTPTQIAQAMRTAWPRPPRPTLLQEAADIATRQLLLLRAARSS